MKIIISKSLALSALNTGYDIISTLPFMGEKMDSRKDLRKQLHKSFNKDTVLESSKICTVKTQGQELVIEMNDNYLKDSLDIARNTYVMVNSLIPSLMSIGKYYKDATDKLQKEYED